MVIKLLYIANVSCWCGMKRSCSGLNVGRVTARSWVRLQAVCLLWASCLVPVMLCGCNTGKDFSCLTSCILRAYKRNWACWRFVHCSGIVMAFVVDNNRSHVRVRRWVLVPRLRTTVHFKRMALVHRHQEASSSSSSRRLQRPTCHDVDLTWTLTSHRQPMWTTARQRYADTPNDSALTYSVAHCGVSTGCPWKPLCGSLWGEYRVPLKTTLWITVGWVQGAPENHSVAHCGMSTGCPWKTTQ